MLLHCIAFKNRTPRVLPSSSSAGKSTAVLASSVSGLSTVALSSATISNRHVSGVSRAATKASPVSVCGTGLPRLTSLKSLAGVRNGRAGGASDKGERGASAP